MSSRKCELRIGTSGWHYDHWKERFYPHNLPKNEWLDFYTQHFDTVEINNTFYHLPKEQTFENWRKKAPKGFKFTVKANRYITHIKKINNCEEELQRFFERIEMLKSHLGPILYQLPPSLHKDVKRLAAFVKLLPKRHTSVFEFRHKSWYCDDTYELLDASGVGFCIHDLGELTTPRLITGGRLYIRFHGTSGRYRGNYTKPMLKKWADWIKQHTSNAHAAYAYFNNDIQAHAVNNAKTLRELVVH